MTGRGSRLGRSLKGSGSPIVGLDLGGGSRSLVGGGGRVAVGPNWKRWLFAPGLPSIEKLRSNVIA